MFLQNASASPVTHHRLRSHHHRPHFASPSRCQMTAPSSWQDGYQMSTAMATMLGRQGLNAGWSDLAGRPPAPAGEASPWAGLQEAVQSAVKPNTMPGFEEAARRNAASEFVKTKMSGEQLYYMMSSIQDPQAQAAFYRDAQGTGAGMNNLAEVVLEKRFHGDQGEANRWINLHNSGGWAGKPGESEQYGPGGLGSWDFSRGLWKGGNTGERTVTLPGWGG